VAGRKSKISLDKVTRALYNWRRPIYLALKIFFLTVSFRLAQPGGCIKTALDKQSKKISCALWRCAWL
jgi:hypothetical protein